MSDEELMELNVWIAENVFGWMRWTFDNGYTSHNYLTAQRERQDKFHRRGWVDGRYIIQTFPKSSSESADAMEVLKKCAEKLPVSIFVSVADPGTWVCCYESPEGVGDIDADAPTLELAIARFAKKLFSK